MHAWRRWLWTGRLGWLAALGALGFAASCGDGGSGGKAAKDTQPPRFDGATEATALDDGTALVSWEAASDDVSPKARIAYRVYAARKGESIDFDRHTAISPAGSSSLGVSGLPQGVPLELVVRAVDEAGNEDDNEETAEVTLPDLLAPQFAGVGDVTALSASSIEVSWPAAEDSVGVERYLVYLSEEERPFDAEPRELPADETSTVFEDLDEATTYYAAVRAVDGAGHHDGNRRVASATTLDATAPDFAGVDSLAVGGTALLVRWLPATDNVTAPEDIDYRIYTATDPDGFDFESPAAEVTGTDYLTLTGLEPDTTLYVVVRAVDEAGNEDDNELDDSITTGAGEDTTPPVFAGADTATELGARTIQVSWSEATDDLTPTEALLYDVWYSTTPGEQDFGEDPQATSTLGATSVDVTGLEPGTTYYFKVRARDLQGLRDDNDVEVSATTMLDDTPPVFAGVSTVTGGNATTLSIAWLPASDDTFPQANITYDVYVASASGGQNFSAPTVSVTGETSTEVSGLARETTYYVVVRARDPEGNGETNEKEASGSTLPDTTGPVLATAPTVTALSDSSLGVSWVEATDDTYGAADLVYTVLYGTESGGPYTEGPTTAAGVTNADLTGLAVDTTYYVVVRALDPSDNEGQSPEGSAETSSDDTPPTFTATPTLSATTTLVSGTYRNNVTVTWTAATDNVTAQEDIYYEICMSANAACATFTAHATTAAGATSRPFNGLDLDTPYYFTVRAVDAAGNRTPSPAVTDAVVPATLPTPTLSANGTSVTVTYTPGTDAVFGSLRYRVVHRDACDTWQPGTWTAPRTAGGSVDVVANFGDNRAYVQAMDGFGNVRSSSAAVLARSASADAATVLDAHFEAHCTGSGCHGGTDSAFVAWTTTSAKQSPSPVGPAGAVVVANDLAGSRMYDRVTRSPGSGGFMPPGSATQPLPVVCNLARWINAGIP